MAMTVYNPQKGRFETIDAAITQDNTTSFEGCVEDHDIQTITDFKGGLLIRSAIPIPSGYTTYREPISNKLSERQKR